MIEPPYWHEPRLRFTTPQTRSRLLWTAAPSGSRLDPWKQVNRWTNANLERLFARAPARPARRQGGWIEFDGPLELLLWGRNTYTVVYLADLLHGAVIAVATRRVDGRLDAVQVNLGVNKADVVARPYVYVGAALQRRLGARAADVMACRLRPTPTPTPTTCRCLLTSRPLSTSRAGTALSRAAVPPSGGGFCSRSRTPPRGRRG